MTYRRDSLEQIFLKAVGHLESASPGSDVGDGSGTQTEAAPAAPVNRTVADGRL